MIKQTSYVANDTQEGRILDFLRERGERGIFVYELMAPKNKGGLGIAQYNARIWSLRRKGYVITNAEPGHFVLAFDVRASKDRQKTVFEEIRNKEKVDADSPVINVKKYKWVFDNKNNCAYLVEI